MISAEKDRLALHIYCYLELKPGLSLSPGSKQSAGLWAGRQENNEVRNNTAGITIKWFNPIKSKQSKSVTNKHDRVSVSKNKNNSSYREKSVSVIGECGKRRKGDE